MQNLEDEDNLGIQISDSLTKFEVDFSAQRCLMDDDSQRQMDAKWMCDNFGKFSFNVKHKIRVDMRQVFIKSHDVIEKLKHATDIHQGLEILHLFVLDILGRNSVAAKIFIGKCDQDFRHATVVSKFAKQLAWAAVAILNIMFVYFSILRGLERGYHWQKVYAIAAVTQTCLEIFFYETCECVIVHYFIPSLVREEVQAAQKRLHTIISKICADHENDGSEGGGQDQMLLNIPNYFYISHKLA